MSTMTITEVVAYNSSHHPPLNKAVLRSLTGCFKPHSYLTSCDLNRSNDRVGQGLTVVSPVTPGDGNNPWHFSYLGSCDENSGSITFRITSKEDSHN